MNYGPSYTEEELDAWLDDCGPPVIHRKADTGNGSSPDNPFTRFAEALGAGKAPIDVEKLLAEMLFHGPGGGGNAHATLLSCSAAMIARGENTEVIVAKGLAALTAAAERSGVGFDPIAEARKIREMCAGAIAKGYAPETAEAEKTEPFKPLATVYACPNPGLIPPREFLLGRHYIRDFVTATIAPGGTGKSSRSLVEAIAMVTDKPLLGVRPRRGPLRVWYYGEDPKVELDRRIAAILQHYEIHPDEIKDRLCVDSIHNLRLKELAVAKPDRSGAKVIFDERLLGDLVETFRTRKLDVAIFDPLVTLHSVPENDPASMDAVVRKFGVIAEQVHAAIDLVHHTRKPTGGQTGMTVDDARGARAIIDAARAARVLNRMSSKEAEPADIEPEECWRYFRSDSGKANLAPPDVAVWSELNSVIIPNSDNVGVVAPWTYPSALDGVTADDARWIRALVRAEPDHGYHPNAKTWIGIPLATRLGLDHEDKADRAKLRRILRTWRAAGVIAVQEWTDPGTRKKRDCVKPGEAPSEEA